MRISSKKRLARIAALVGGLTSLWVAGGAPIWQFF